MLRYLLVLFSVLFFTTAHTQVSENVFLVTLDGLRWQELFGGAVDSMMLNKDLTHNEDVYQKYSALTKEEARKKLMPFMWSTIADEGLLMGNRWEGSKMNCTNRYWFSYPGYNEILTGFSDPNINSNAKEYNANKTILEIANEEADFSGKVAAFCSWDVFPYIINDKRSGIYVNAAFNKADHQNLSGKEEFLNQLLSEVPSPWSSVRLDAWTHHYMMEYVQNYKPRLVYISYGETDDFAHDGRYDHYLNSSHQTDKWLSELWDYIQGDPHYKDKTSLVITTDHGRGDSPMTEWKNHGTIYMGSSDIWLAAIGPHISALGEIKEKEQTYQNQVSRTVTTLLGIHYEGGIYEAGEPLQSIVGKQ